MGLVLLLLGVTGALTVFRNEIDWLITPSLRVTPGSKKADLDSIVKNVQSAHSDYRITTIGLQPGPRFAHIFYVSNKANQDGEVFADPYTGEIKGERFGLKLGQVIKSFHTNLLLNFAGPTPGKVGRIAAGTFGALFVTLTLTGLVIYGKFWKSIFRVRFNRGRQILWSDLHKTIGLWSLLFNLIIGVTAAMFGYEAIAGKRGGERGRMAERKQPAETPATSSAPLEVQPLISATSELFPDLDVTVINLPRRPGGDTRVTGKHKGTRFFRQASSVEFNPDGETKKVSDARQKSGETSLIAIAKPVHFTSWVEGSHPAIEYGFKALWCLLGLSPGLLAITGALLFFKRSKNRNTDLANGIV